MKLEDWRRWQEERLVLLAYGDYEEGEAHHWLRLNDHDFGPFGPGQIAKPDELAHVTAIGWGMDTPDNGFASIGALGGWPLGRYRERWQQHFTKETLARPPTAPKKEKPCWKCKLRERMLGQGLCYECHHAYRISRLKPKRPLADCLVEALQTLMGQFPRKHPRQHYRRTLKKPNRSTPMCTLCKVHKRVGKKLCWSCLLTAKAQNNEPKRA